MDTDSRKPWYSQNFDEVYAALHTSKEGLSDAEAAKRLIKHGLNELRTKPPRSILEMEHPRIRAAF